MNKFQKLSQLNKDIELLENAGKLKAADVLHKKFIKEAQYAMPQMMTTMMPQMMMPQMMSMMPQMMPMTMARPVAPGAVARPAVAPAAVAKPVGTPAPVQQGQVTPPAPQPSPTPNPAPAPPPTNKEIKPPYTGTTPPPTPPPTQYGDKNKKDQELQYLENELQRLQREYGMDCGPFAAQCNTLRGMIDKNKGGSVAKS
jgi:hypothetical protein